jgi:hypothetical protein
VIEEALILSKELATADEGENREDLRQTMTSGLKSSHFL